MVGVKIFSSKSLERSGSVVECLTREQGDAGLSLTGVTANKQSNKLLVTSLAPCSAFSGQD